MIKLLLVVAHADQDQGGTVWGVGHSEIRQRIQKGESQAVIVTNHHGVLNYHDVLFCSAASHACWEFLSYPYTLPASWANGTHLLAFASDSAASDWHECIHL